MHEFAQKRLERIYDYNYHRLVDDELPFYLLWLFWDTERTTRKWGMVMECEHCIYSYFDDMEHLLCKLDVCQPDYGYDEREQEEVFEKELNKYF